MKRIKQSYIRCLYVAAACLVASSLAAAHSILQDHTFFGRLRQETQRAIDEEMQRVAPFSDDLYRFMVEEINGTPRHQKIVVQGITEAGLLFDRLHLCPVYGSIVLYYPRDIVEDDATLQEIGALTLPDLHYVLNATGQISDIGREFELCSRTGTPMAFTRIIGGKAEQPIARIEGLFRVRIARNGVTEDILFAKTVECGYKDGVWSVLDTHGSVIRISED